MLSMIKGIAVLMEKRVSVDTDWCQVRLDQVKFVSYIESKTLMIVN